VEGYAGTLLIFLLLQPARLFGKELAEGEIRSTEAIDFG